MPAPLELRQLVDGYASHRDACRSAAYGETQLGREYLAPLFGLLGWELEGLVGAVRELSLGIERPSVDIVTDGAPAYRLRRRAWSAGLRLGVLTNFEHLAVYDARTRPSRADRASADRVLLLAYEEYAERWEELADLLSREAVLRGSPDRVAGPRTSRRRAARFEDAFLADIERWRKLLADSIARDDGALEQRAVNGAAQRALDRILFMRIAEDRGIEPFGRLREAARGAGIHGRLGRLFRYADAKYSSGLFHPRGDRSRAPEAAGGSPRRVTVGDEPLKTIIRELYDPDSPYEFSAVPLEILGQVYERFLGKEIKLTARGAEVEEKPLVRKAGGVFYTPAPIVRFIVANTLGPLLDGKTPGPRGGASRVRVLDPACGSGSFLIGAYQLLLDWHRDRYLAEGAEEHPRELRRAAGDAWALTISEKTRILVNCVFGVDVDEQAVEVTKLSLLLKLLEGESAQTLERQLELFHDRALPDLSSNIRCGDALVGADWGGGAITRIDEETPFPVAPFDWQAEFRSVFASRGGFDVIVGNPPYVSLQSGLVAPDLRRYLETHYTCYERITDHFALFLERAVSLLADGGACGMIVPSTLLGNLSFTRLREHLLRSTSLTSIVHMGDGVFRDAVVPTCIVTMRKPHRPKNVVRVIGDVEDLAGGELDRTDVRQARLLAEPHFAFNVHASDAVDEILEAVTAASVSLGTLLDIKEGIKTGDDAVFLSDRPAGPRSRKVLKGRDVEQYAILPSRRFIEYDPDRLSRPQRPDHFEVPEKLLVRRVGDRLVAAHDRSQHYCVHTLYTARPRSDGGYPLKFLLALLNSRVLQFVHRKTNPQKGKVFPEVRIYSLNDLPVPSLSTGARRERADRIAGFADRVIEAAAGLASAASPHDRDARGRELSAVREELEAEIYRLFGLSADQVAAVERFCRASRPR
jgi:hypothetical protein